MKRLIGLSIVIFSTLGACQPPCGHSGGWQKVFANDAGGNTVFGQKSALIDAVRLGYPVRVGFGGGGVEHVAEADFLTVLGGREVFAQISTIVGQAPAVEKDTIKMRFRTQNHWTKMAGTNGYETAFMTDYFQDSMVGGGVDRYRSTTWYVHFPQSHGTIQAAPIGEK